MALNARYLADKSALARMSHAAVAERMVPLLLGGEIATCAIIDLEVLYSARSLRDYEQVRAERDSLESLPLTGDVTALALDAQHRLALIGQHRVPVPDLLIAATAQHYDITLLHYDRDFDQIAGVTGQPTEWVVPRGSL